LETILSIQQLSKSYGTIQALKNVSFEVPAGSVFGVLGPNGSGKTTLLAILLDVLNADSGHYAWFGGSDATVARKQIGSLLETPNFYHYLSARNNLEITASIKERGKDDIEKVLQQVGLLERQHSLFQTFSLGMKQRLAIANALLGNPKVVLLDEPTNGLDPAGIAEIRGMIKTMSNMGITVIMASHLLDEVEKVCTHVAILKRGELLVSGSVNDVLSSDDRVEIQSEDITSLQTLVQQFPNVSQVTTADGFVYLHGKELNLAQINKQCMEQGIILTHLVHKKKNLETKFMELTQITE